MLKISDKREKGPRVDRTIGVGRAKTLSYLSELLCVLVRVGVRGYSSALPPQHSKIL